MRWIPPDAAHRTHVDAGRHPVRETRALRYGEEKRLLQRLGQHDSAEDAMERSKGMPWYRRIVSRRPTCDARWWIFIVRVA